MEEFIKLVAQYQCNTKVDVSSSESDSDSDITSEAPEQVKIVKDSKDGISETGKRKSGAVRLPTRRPDPNVYNRNALLARENRRKKKAHMEAVEKELDKTRSTNKMLLKALKKQFKLTQKLESECKLLKDILGNYKDDNSSAGSSPNDQILSFENRSASPEGSLISAHSSSSLEQPMDASPFIGLLDVDNGSVAQQHFINEPPTSSWYDLIDDLLTDYQPTPVYENENLNRYLEETSLELEKCQSPLNPLGVINEHSYFNKYAEIGSSPDYAWSPSCTPPSQLLQDDSYLNMSSGAYIASL